MSAVLVRDHFPVPAPARRGPRSPAPACGPLELVSVVIPARNEAQHIERCLDSVLAQTYRPLEVLVVDGASTDRTAELVAAYAQRHPEVRLLDNPRAIVPTSLNLGLRAACGRWFVRIDAHATVDPDYVRLAVEHLRTGRWGGVGGRVDAIGVTPAGRAIAAAMGSRFGIGNSVHHYGTEAQPADHVPFPAYEPDEIRALGGWDERLPVNQDFELDYRLGQRGRLLLYEPRMVIQYHCQQSLRGLARQFRRYGRGKVGVLRLHPRSARPRHLVPPALVASWVAAAGLARRRPGLAAASLVPYALGVAAAVVATRPEMADRAARRRLPAAFVVMHASWGLGFWQGVADQACGLRRR